jgi:hypothetical protein
VTCLDADDLADLLHEATSGKFPQALTRPQRQALGRAIESCAEQLPSAAVVAVLRDYVKQGMPGFETQSDRDRMTPEDRAIRSRGICPELVSAPGWLSLALQRASTWAEGVAAKRALLTDQPLFT